MTIWTTPERDQLRKTVRSFAEREILPHVDEWERIGNCRGSCIGAPAQRAAGAGFPEAVGGGGGDGADSVIICEELHEAGVPGGVYASLFTCGIAVPHMIASGDERLIQTFVRPTLAGRRSVRWRSPSRWRLRRRSSTHHRGPRRRPLHRQRRQNLHHLRVRADYVVTAVRTGGPGAAGVSLLVVEKGTPGSRSPASSTRWVGAPRIPPSCPTPTRGCRRLILSAPKTAASPRSHRLSWQNVSALPRKRIRVHNAAWTSRGSGAATGKPSADR
ncbi:putative acyl-CoA dehydrogenase [Mycobacterium xenopi 4042]|uniref:Putative acyl-CoA dehydrogenase n=1 Tax=Mycobacterium xenopi 4042 TaxID=1299334 RepID=X8AEU0_MYCXE|nr:putative acyl-CoA dehydrogenase [Mycobacterium xenopi 4042]